MFDVIDAAFAVVTRWIENGADEECVYAPTKPLHVPHSRRCKPDALAASTFWRLLHGEELPIFRTGPKRPGCVNAALYLLDAERLEDIRRRVAKLGDGDACKRYIARREEVRAALSESAHLRVELWSDGSAWAPARKRKRKRG